MKTLKIRKESAVALEDVPRPEILKKPNPEEKAQCPSICPYHCNIYTPPCPSKK